MGASSKSRVMIVEDEALISLMLQTVLENNGFEVVGIADEFDDALRLFGESQPDVILMDVSIIGARDGIETARAIRAQRPVPVIFLTAYTDRATVQRIRDTGAYDVLSKPLDTTSLKQMVCSALAASIESR